MEDVQRHVSVTVARRVARYSEQCEGSEGASLVAPRSSFLPKRESERVSATRLVGVCLEILVGVVELMGEVRLSLALPKMVLRSAWLRL